MTSYPEEHRQRRMDQDRAMILAPTRWPLITLQMKTQPWVKRQEFGFIEEGDLLAVHIRGDGDEREVRHYPSIEKLVEHWSVD